MAGDLTNDPLLAPVPIVEGRKRLGGCVLQSFIGKGGMGTVYRGRHVKLDVEVAVKCLHPHLASSNPQIVRRFEREGRLAARVNHPNVVRVFDVGDEHGLRYIVMELVKGETARERVARKGPLVAGEAGAIVLEAARGLAIAHREGIVHRDLKPDNILISAKGEVKVADLGLGCMRAEAAGDENLTATGIAIGTPRYMPPEQWDGLEKVGLTGDVWALGATLYFLLAGTDPFAGEERSTILRQVLTEQFPDVRDVVPAVSDRLAEVVRRCTERNPTARFPTAQALVEALEAALAEEPRVVSLGDPGTGTVSLPSAVVSPPPRSRRSPSPESAPTATRLGTVPRPARSNRPERARIAVVSVLVGLALAGTIAWFSRPRSEAISESSRSAGDAQVAPADREPPKSPAEVAEKVKPTVAAAPAGTPRAPVSVEPEVENEPVREETVARHDPPVEIEPAPKQAPVDAVVVSRPRDAPAEAPASAVRPPEPQRAEAGTVTPTPTAPATPPATPIVTSTSLPIPAPNTSAVPAPSPPPSLPPEPEAPAAAPPAAPPARPPEVAGFRFLGRSAAGLPEYAHEATGIVMVLLPGGETSIGSSLDEVERVSTQINAVASDARIATFWKQTVRAEGPPHPASLRPFLIAREELSQAAWTKAMGSNPSHVRGDDLPVEGVSWDDAKAFCKKTGLSLPTEAQWEYACRAGGTASAEAPSSPSRSLLPARAAPANGFGLRGMLGNVWEWCEDAYDERFYTRMEASGLEPQCVTESPLAARVLRGGAWASPPWTRRPAARESAPPSKGRELRGFRVVKRL